MNQEQLKQICDEAYAKHTDQTTFRSWLDHFGGRKLRYTVDVDLDVEDTTRRNFKNLSDLMELFNRQLISDHVLISRYTKIHHTIPITPGKKDYYKLEVYVQLP